MSLPDSTPDASAFEAYRPLMFSIAYRMLGSISEAEDIVQEAYLRYQGTPPDEIVSHKAFLSTIVTRLCLNHLQSARAQRESYIGPWLPEPLLTSDDSLAAPGHEAELHDSLSIAFLTLLEQLTPSERAVFLLREVFDYDYAEIAEILGKDDAACRQMLSRARKHIADHRPRFKPTPEAHQHILNEFIQAVTTGNLDDLMQLLSEDVVMWADGGGKARGAAIHPLHGREPVSRFVMASSSSAPGPLSVEVTSVNGEPAAIIRSGDKPIAVTVLTIDQDKITEVRAIGNPDKLTRIVQRSK